MSGTGQDVHVTDAGAAYAGFARAFKYPEGAEDALTCVEYTDAFDQGASSSAVSIRESTYVDMDASALFEELVRYYEHFGLRRREDAELPDHISIELEFMHFLCELEHHAALNGEDAASVRNAQRDFIDRHVDRNLKGILRGLSGRTGNAVELAKACVDFVASHRQSLPVD